MLYMHSVAIASPVKFVHTNLHTVSNNLVNRPHIHYVNSYFTQIMTLVCKTKCYQLTLPRPSLKNYLFALTLPTHLRSLLPKSFFSPFLLYLYRLKNFTGFLKDITFKTKMKK